MKTFGDFFDLRIRRDERVELRREPLDFHVENGGRVGGSEGGERGEDEREEELHAPKF